MSKKKFKDTTVGQLLLGATSVINPTLGNVLKGVTSPQEAIGGRPWIAKHFKSSMSPLKEGHEGGSPMSKHDGKEFGDDGFMDTHFKSGKPREGAPSNMNHDNSPASKYMSAVEKHCMGPRMSALEQEEPKKMLVKKIKKKPKKA